MLYTHSNDGDNSDVATLPLPFIFQWCPVCVFHAFVSWVIKTFWPSLTRNGGPLRFKYARKFILLLLLRSCKVHNVVRVCRAEDTERCTAVMENTKRIANWTSHVTYPLREPLQIRSSTSSFGELPSNVVKARLFDLRMIVTIF